MRVVALAGALGLAAAGMAACDGSPPAIDVGGRVLSVSAFNHQLTEWVADKPLVEQLNESAAGQAAEQGSQAQTVAGAGGSGTYSLSFVDQVLQFNIEVMAVQRYLSAKGKGPTADQLEAARAYEDVNRPQYWDQLAAPLRQLFVDDLADLGALTAPPSSTSSLKSAYTQIEPWVFSSVCVIEADAPDLSTAQSVVSSGQVDGAQVCFDQQALEAQPAALQSAVVGLTKVGQVSKPVKTSFGYQVLQLASRTAPGLDAGVAQVLTAASTTPPVLGTIIETTHISVNSLYGSWTQDCLVPPGSTVQEACGSDQ